MHARSLGTKLISCARTIRSRSELTGTAARVQSGAWVDKDASLHPSCMIGHGARVFGHVELEERVRVEANAVVYGPARIGAGSLVGPNVVLGFPSRKDLTEAVSLGRGFHELPNKGQLVVGRDCIIRSGTCIYSDVMIGDSVSFGHNVMVRENVRIGTHTLVGTNVVIDGSCDIGERVSIQTGGYICTNCKIEDSVFIGPHAVLTNDKYVTQKKTRLVGPTIRRGASIGANSLLMPSIEIGEGSIIGAQSLVMRNVPSCSIFAGAPAKKLKKVPANWRTSLLQP